MVDKVVILGELYSSKNSRRILRAGNRFIVAKSAVAKGQESELIFQLNILRREWQKLIEGKKYPLEVVFKIYRKTKRRFDYINIIQNLQDCMVKANWLPDDDMEHLLPVFEPYEVDKKNPRVEIFIK